ncbi:hypothetical protein Droror1_Dr00000287 [Drosera rotundifolia]
MGTASGERGGGGSGRERREEEEEERERRDLKGEKARRCGFSLGLALRIGPLSVRLQVVEGRKAKGKVIIVVLGQIWIWTHLHSCEVAGRTSEMSAVGLLPAALQGIDIKEMLAGAALMDEATRTTVLRNDPSTLLALCWYWASNGVDQRIWLFCLTKIAYGYLVSIFSSWSWSHLEKNLIWMVTRYSF